MYKSSYSVPLGQEAMRQQANGACRDKTAEDSTQFPLFFAFIWTSFELQCTGVRWCLQGVGHIGNSSIVLLSWWEESQVISNIYSPSPLSLYLAKGKGDESLVNDAGVVMNAGLGLWNSEHIFCTLWVAVPLHTQMPSLAVGFESVLLAVKQPPVFWGAKWIKGNDSFLRGLNLLVLIQLILFAWKPLSSSYV